MPNTCKKFATFLGVILKALTLLLLCTGVWLVGQRCHAPVEESISDADRYRLWEEARARFQPLMPYDTAEWTREERYYFLWGQRMFYDSSLGRGLACASCHPVEQYGTDRLATSKGGGHSIARRNAPSVFHTAYQSGLFWDMRSQRLDEQFKEPLFSPNEMRRKDSTDILDYVHRAPEYALFRRVLVGEGALQMKHIGRALATYQKYLVTPSRWDSFLLGDVEALDMSELRGLEAFLELGCVRCHDGILLGGQRAARFSPDGRYWHYTGSLSYDAGMYQWTGRLEDKLVFKVPQLRNVAETYPYFHDGSVATLHEAIRMMAQAQGHMSIDAQTVCDIEAFLNALTGSIPLYAIRPSQQAMQRQERVP